MTSLMVIGCDQPCSLPVAPFLHKNRARAFTLPPGVGPSAVSNQPTRSGGPSVGRRSVGTWSSAPVPISPIWGRLYLSSTSALVLGAPLRWGLSLLARNGPQSVRGRCTDALLPPRKRWAMGFGALLGRLFT
jgi:hypothetical protein